MTRAVVVEWTGREARLLREAHRMTVREFAAHLGASERTISKWEAGGRSIRPRPEMQSALDTSLTMAPPAVKNRFEQACDEIGAGAQQGPNGIAVRSHRLFPVFVGRDRIAKVAGRYSFGPPMPSWTQCRGVELAHPEASAGVYVFKCGVLILHVCQSVGVARIAELAVWRHDAQVTDTAWAAEQLARLLPKVQFEPPRAQAPMYWLDRAGWPDVDRDTALRLMCHPAVLVDRDHPAGPKPVGTFVEQWHLASAYEHPDITSFGLRGVSIGFASWAGRAYATMSPGRALPPTEILAVEMTAQMLACYARWLHTNPDTAHTLGGLGEFGVDYLENGLTQLAGGPDTPSLQHSLLRTAVLNATGLPDLVYPLRELLAESPTPPPVDGATEGATGT